MWPANLAAGEKFAPRESEASLLAPHAVRVHPRAALEAKEASKSWRSLACEAMRAPEGEAERKVGQRRLWPELRPVWSLWPVWQLLASWPLARSLAESRRPSEINHRATMSHLLAVYRMAARILLYQWEIGLGGRNSIGELGINHSE